MNKTILCAAFTGLLVAGAASAQADNHAMAAKEKCYGVAKAGKNDCASLSGSHSCAGYSAKDKDKDTFKLVPAGECVKMGGSLATPKK